MQTPQNDDDQRRLLLAVVLSGVVLLLWSTLFPSVPVEPPPAETVASEQVKPDASTPAAGPDGVKPAASAADVLDIERKVIGRLEEVDHHVIEFTNVDGQIANWSLTEPQYRDDLEDGTVQPFDFLGPVERVITAAKSGDEDASGKEGIFEAPTLDLMLAGKTVRGAYTVAEQSDRALSMGFTDPGSGVAITRTYRLDESGYTISVDLTLKNDGGQAVPYDLAAVFKGVQNDEEATGSMFMPPVYLFESICKYGEEFERFTASDITSALEDGDPVAFETAVRWAGVDNRYFMTALLAEIGTIERCTAGTDKDGLPTTFSRLITTIDLLGGEIPAGGEVTRTFKFYAGPKKLSELQKTAPAMGDAIDFGWFSAICVPMLWLMRFFFEYVGNWGVAIILLTIVVRGITFPVTLKQYKSMARMKILQPEVKALQAKYKEDPPRMQQEMMKLYREHKVNPLAGCLPMFLMMPIYFSLYRTIYSAVELYRANFAGWLTDLSIQDPYYITPLLLGGLMFIQMRLNPSAGAEAQQKIIMYVMPVMFTAMMLFLPSGLVIYILVSTMLGIVQQMYMLKKNNPAPTPAKA